MSNLPDGCTISDLPGFGPECDRPACPDCAGEGTVAFVSGEGHAYTFECKHCDGSGQVEPPELDPDYPRDDAMEVA